MQHTNPLITPYRRDIDGLRGFAVLLVLIYHMLPQALRGGFCGVDVFFVISGYLITWQIQNDLAAGNFGFAAFYARRIRRIFPALILVLLASLAYGFVILLPSELAQLGADIQASAAFAANLLLWHQAGYFDRAALAKPLLHLWSLGVEEQFYIIWPLLLWALHRTRRVAAVIMLVALISWGLCAALALPNPVQDFYSPATRLWELAAGGLLAVKVLHTANQPGALHAASAGGLFLVLGSAIWLAAPMPYPGWLVSLPVAGAVCLIGAGPRAFVNQNLLSSRFAVYLGRISYPLYLWHWPLLAYAHILNNDRALKTFPALCLIAASIALAAATERWVERYFRFGAAKPAKTGILISGMAILFLGGGLVSVMHGFPGRMANLPQQDLSNVTAAVDDGIFQPTSAMRVQKLQGITVARIGASGDAVLITGDSVVFQYGPRVQALLASGQLHHQVIFITGPNCIPVPGMAYAPLFAVCTHMPQVTAQLLAAQHVSRIVLGGDWQNFAHEPDFYVNLLAELSAYRQAGYKVWLILPVPLSQRFDPALMLRRSLTGISIESQNLAGVPLASLRAQNAALTQALIAVAAKAGVQTIDPLPQICGQGPVCSAFFQQDQPKFADDIHMRPIFVRQNIRFLDAILTQP